MKISKAQTIREDWGEVKSWNYQLTQLSPKMSVVYAELNGKHGEVKTSQTERVYYILEGQGEFTVNGKIIRVKKDDVVTVPAYTNYDYTPLTGLTLKVLLFMELWKN